ASGGYWTGTLRGRRRPAGGASSSPPIRSSCQRQSRSSPSSTWRFSARTLRRSSPASSSISETRQQALPFPSRCAIVLLLPEGHPQPLILEGGPQELARGQRSRQQQVAALIIHLDDQLLAMGEDLDLVLLREGQAEVEGVAARLLADLHRLLAEEDLGG